MKLRILGMDNSRYSTGWAVADIDTNTKNKQYREGIKLVDYGYIDTTSIKEEGKTLIYLEDKFSELIERYNPDEIAAEQQFAGKNAQTGFILAGIHAIMKLCAAKKDIPITYYSVMSMKSITLNGMKLKKEDGTRKTSKELKQEVANVVINFFDNIHFDNITDDVTDAISAIITYVRQDGKPIGKQSANVKKTAAKKKIMSDETTIETKKRTVTKNKETTVKKKVSKKKKGEVECH